MAAGAGGGDAAKEKAKGLKNLNGGQAIPEVLWPKSKLWK